MQFRNTKDIRDRQGCRALKNAGTHVTSINSVTAMLAKGTNKMIILLIGSPMNRIRNFTLSHNETSIAKTDHKNEISAKN